MEDYEIMRATVVERIDVVEKAVVNLQAVRKSLLLHAYEAKQSILSAFSRQRDSLRSREIFLLNQVDTVLQSKDDALVTQLSKLNQVLGCLRNCLDSPHPCGECLEKFDDIDMVPIEQCELEFTANDVLREAIHNFGHVNHDSENLPTNSERQSIQSSGAFNTEKRSSNRLAWLLSPTNVQKTPEHRKEEVLGAQVEWLVQYHPTSTHKGEEMSDHFLAIKSEMRDAWLNAENRKQSNSLHGYVIDQFRLVREESQKDWLQDQGHLHVDIKSECSESTICTEATSSLQSSCVVISRSVSTSSEYPNMTRSAPENAAWLRGRRSPGSQRLSLSSSSDVCDWVASCCPHSDTDEWLQPVRRNSVVSLDWPKPYSRLIPEAVEEACSVASSRPSEEWLMRNQAASVRETSANSWLSTPRRRFTVDWSPASLSLSGEMMMKSQTSASLDAQEKLDTNVEKIANSDWLTTSTPAPVKHMNVHLNKPGQSWLQSSGDNSQVELDETDAWLVGTSAQDNPANYSVMVSEGNSEWLVVMEHLKSISISKSSEWLFNEKMDNRLAEKQEVSNSFTSCSGELC